MKQRFNLLAKNLLLFWFGGSTYCTLEVLFRGRSHWTMVLLGAILFVSIGMINEIIPWNMGLLKQGLIGAVDITALEFICGYIINIQLGWGVWDYSNMPFNIMGQVCPQFFLLWIVVAILAIIIDDYLRCLIFGDYIPHYTLFTHKEHMPQVYSRISDKE